MVDNSANDQADFDGAAKGFWGSFSLGNALSLFGGLSPKAQAEAIGKVLGWILEVFVTSPGIDTSAVSILNNFTEWTDKLLDNSELPDSEKGRIRRSLQGIKTGNPFADIIIAWLTPGFVMVKQCLSVGDIANQRIARVIKRKIKYDIGSYDDLYQYWLQKGKTIEYKQCLPDLGFNDSWLTILKDSRRVLPNLGELGELLRRGEIKPEDFQGKATILGYTNRDDEALLRSLTKQLIPLNVSLELLRRGEINYTQCFKEISKHGFDENTLDGMIKTRRPLLGLSEVIPLYIRGYMTQGETVDALEKHGYTTDDMYKLLDLGKHPLTEDQLFRMRWRDIITDDVFIKGMIKLGYEEEDAVRLMRTLWQPASPSDMVRFAVREVWSPDVAAKFRLFDEFPPMFAIEVRKSGIGVDTAKQYWAAHWSLPSPGQGFDMYHRGIIDHDELTMLLRTLDVNPFWREKMIKLCDRLIPRRQLRYLLQEDIETADQVEGRYVKLGYSKDDAKVLTAVDVSRVAEDYKDATKGEVMKAFISGFLNEKELRKALDALFYSKDAIDFYVADCKRKKYLKDATADAKPNEQFADKALGDLTDDIVKQYQAGMIPKDDATRHLRALGYYPETAEFFLAHADLQQFTKDMSFYAGRIKGMFDHQAIDKTEACRQLVLQGFDVVAAEKLIAKWDYAEYAAVKVEDAKEIAPTKAEMKRWTPKGIVSVEEYETYLLDLGYDETSRTNYIIELMLDIET